MKKEHTLILFEHIDGSKFFKVEDNLSRYHDIYIGQEDDPKEIELSDIIYNDDGDFKLKEIDNPTKDYTWFIKCGSL